MVYLSPHRWRPDSKQLAIRSSKEVVHSVGCKSFTASFHRVKSYRAGPFHATKSLEWSWRVKTRRQIISRTRKWDSVIALPAYMLDRSLLIVAAVMSRKTIQIALRRLALWILIWQKWLAILQRNGNHRLRCLFKRSTCKVSEAFFLIKKKIQKHLRILPASWTKTLLPSLKRLMSPV